MVLENLILVLVLLPTIELGNCNRGDAQRDCYDIWNNPD
jgi:hypothetical protein